MKEAGQGRAHVIRFHLYKVLENAANQQCQRARGGCLRDRDRWDVRRTEEVRKLSVVMIVFTLLGVVMVS